MPVASRMSPSEDTNDDFPYENLVLRGGGAKTLAYIGALEVRTWRR